MNIFDEVNLLPEIVIARRLGLTSARDGKSFLCPNCGNGLRYVIYMYMTALDDPTRVIAEPAGFFLAPEGWEYIGDVMNVAFANGWIADEDGKVFIYYASSDTRLHVATSTVERLVDYCMNTPADGFRTGLSVEAINHLIDKNV